MKTFLTALLLLMSTQLFAIIPNREYIRLPEDVGLTYRELDVETRDGYKIACWFFPAETGTPRPTIIICNGDTANMSYIQLFLAEVYTANGYNVATFDWRGFGQSSEFEMDRDYLCYTEMLEDYRAVIARVKRQEEVDRRNIYLLGWSTGAYLTMITAHDNRNVAGVCGVGMPSSFEDVIPHLVKVHPAKKTADNLLVPDDFPSWKMPLHIAPKFRKPVLLITGGNDDRTPVWMAEKVIAALPDNIFKLLSVYEGAGHGGEQSPIFVDTPRFFTETMDFMDYGSRKNRRERKRN